MDAALSRKINAPMTWTTGECVGGNGGREGIIEGRVEICERERERERAGGREKKSYRN